MLATAWARMASKDDFLCIQLNPQKNAIYSLKFIEHLSPQKIYFTCLYLSCLPNSVKNFLAFTSPKKNWRSVLEPPEIPFFCVPLKKISSTGWGRGGGAEKGCILNGMALIWLQITFYFLASSAKTEQQQHQQKANVPVVKSKKRQAMTPADDFQDSDPEDDYGDKSYVILLTFHSCTVGQYHISGSISSGPLSHFSDVNMALSWLI